MRLSMPDKNEFLKAAVKAPDLDTLRRWVVSVVDAIDSLPEGKADAPVPPLTVPVIAPAGNGHTADRMTPWQGDRLT